MLHPHDEHAEEARHECQERRPFIDEALGQRDPAPRGIPEVQREQSDREREDAIAERLHPDGFLLLESFAVHHAPEFGDGREVMYKSVADLGDLEMATTTPLTRDSIIRTLTAELQPLPRSMRSGKPPRLRSTGSMNGPTSTCQSSWPTR